jgi:hypothetical protein
MRIVRILYTIVSENILTQYAPNQSYLSRESFSEKVFQLKKVTFRGSDVDLFVSCFVALLLQKYLAIRYLAKNGAPQSLRCLRKFAVYRRLWVIRAVTNHNL